MSKKRVTIYVDEDVWKSVKIGAIKLGISASDYLLGNLRPLKGIEKPNERSEKPKKLIKTTDDVLKFTGGYSKNHQLGKKG